MACDILYRNGCDLTQLPLRSRRPRLQELVAGSERVFPVRRLAANGLEAWKQVLAAGYEGLVAKDQASPYVGGRTRAWVFDVTADSPQEAYAPRPLRK
jgi:ATP-dependent DNA ligase